MADKMEKNKGKNKCKKAGIKEPRRSEEKVRKTKERKLKKVLKSNGLEAAKNMPLNMD